MARRAGRRRGDAGPALGQMALKSGHSTWWSRLPSIGSACTRAQYSAPKKAAKNITSEKMNQLMLQRNDTSMRSEYRPLSLSPMACLNHWNSVVSQTTMPASSSVGAPAGAVDPLAGAEDDQQHAGRHQHRMPRRRGMK
jgi:hypothetical protein